MSKVAILGGGSFGTALAALLAKKGTDVSIWDRETEVVEDINKNRRNEKYLRDLIIPEKVKAFNDINDAVYGSTFIVLAIPSHVIRGLCSSIRSIINRNQIIISIAKGIEEGTLLRISQIINEVLPENPVVILSGPSHAEEVAAGIPTTVVVSSEDMKYAEMVQDLFMTGQFRVYTNDDLTGVEIGGAVKNIIALAAGIADGIGYGDNSKAALMTRGMSEITRIGIRLGGRRETFSGLTGMGDLIVTCTSMHSRNRRAGILIGKGVSMEDAVKHIGMVVEGIKACKAFYELKEKEEVSMPITDVLYKVLFHEMDPKQGVAELMSRDKKDESY
jgi:glycerol-3-phosphate dehydrogenase (NAD(P)+)